MNGENQCITSVECESSAVHSYLNILQSVISRMASNSASCKSWCITLVTGIIVVLLDKNKNEYIFIALIPAILFFFLDSYYLAAETSFRNKYNAFIKKLHDGQATKTDLFIVAPETNIGFCAIFRSVKSISIWPFYLSLSALIVIILLNFGLNINIFFSI